MYGRERKKLYILKDYFKIFFKAAQEGNNMKIQLYRFFLTTNKYSLLNMISTRFSILRNA